MPTTLVSQLVNVAVDNNITINLTSLSDVSQINMPIQALHSLAALGQSVEIQFPQGSLHLDTDALMSIVSQGRGENLSFTLLSLDMAVLTQAQQSALQNDSNVYRVLAFSSDGDNVTDFDGNLSVTVPFEGEEPQVWRLNEDGNKMLVTSSYENGNITFVTSSLSVFVIGSATSTPLMRFAIGVAFGDAVPFIDAGTNRTMVPLRAIAEGLGAEVIWDDATRTVSITRGGDTAFVTIDTPLPGGMGTTVIQDGRTFVPVRYVSEILGAEVIWDDLNRAVYVN